MIERPKQTKSSELVAMMLIDTHVDVALEVALSGGRRDRWSGTHGLPVTVAGSGCKINWSGRRHNKLLRSQFEQSTCF